MTAISLCSGADGFGLAAQLLGIEVVAHVEIEKIFNNHYKRHFPNAKRFYDLRTVQIEDFPYANIIFGGEPCQGNSVAGKREGTSDDRYLWPDYFRICKGVRPRWIINENVVGSVSNLVLDTKIADLESIGYTCRPFNIPACAVGAFHERQRIWLVAYANGFDGHGDGSSEQNAKLNKRVEEAILPQDQSRSGLSREWTLVRGTSGRVFPTPTHISPVYGMADDVPAELALLKAFGNSVVPWIPYVILKFIIEIEKAC